MANNIKSGSTSDPSTFAPVDLCRAEEYDRRDNCNPNKLLQCPFDKNHQIRSCRFPYHIIKCRKNHPKLASELKSCPFNALHLVLKHELQAHIETCSDRIVVDREEEVDDYAPPFILGRKMEDEK